MFLFMCNYIGETQYSESKNLKTCLNEDTFFLALSPQCPYRINGCHRAFVYVTETRSVFCLMPTSSCKTNQWQPPQHESSLFSQQPAVRTTADHDAEGRRKTKKKEKYKGRDGVARTRGRPAGVTGHDNSRSGCDWT